MFDAYMFLDFNSKTKNCQIKETLIKSKIKINGVCEPGEVWGSTPRKKEKQNKKT